MSSLGLSLDRLRRTDRSTIYCWRLEANAQHQADSDRDAHSHSAEPVMHAPWANVAGSGSAIPDYYLCNSHARAYAGVCRGKMHASTRRDRDVSPDPVDAHLRSRSRGRHRLARDVADLKRGGLTDGTSPLDARIRGRPPTGHAVRTC